MQPLDAGGGEQLPNVQTSAPGHCASDVHDPAETPFVGWLDSGIVEVCSVPSELSHSLWLLCMQPATPRTKTTTSERMPPQLCTTHARASPTRSRVLARGL
jgi:hypothetical protein